MNLNEQRIVLRPKPCIIRCKHVCCSCFLQHITMVKFGQLCLLLTTILSCGTTGQSRPTVRTTDQSKARRLGGGTGFFSTHKLTTCTVWMAFLGNLGALKPPLCESQYACSLNSLNLFTVSLSQVNRHENSYTFTGELRQRAFVAGLSLDTLPPIFITPEFQPPSTQQVLNDTRR